MYGGLPKTTAKQWATLFQEHAPEKPMPVNWLRILIYERTGIRVGQKWLTRRMRKRGLLMSKPDALEAARCECGRLVSLHQKCSLCGKRKEVR